MKIEMFPEGVILLNRELATGLHPALERLLERFPPDETELRLAQIAQYCSIVIDGVYGPEQIAELCAILSGRLEVLREIPIAQKILPLN
jgi:hypothetical protein